MPGNRKHCFALERIGGSLDFQTMKSISQVPSVPVLLFIAATLLVLWGAGVYVTGDYVATLDIAANLISAGFIVAALGGLVRAIERLPARMAEAREASAVEHLDVPPVYSMAPEPVEPERVRTDPRPAQPEPEYEPTLHADEGGPKLVREGVIDGRLYRYYDDGSIHADGPDGPRRYASIDELRAEILKRAERRPAPSPAVVPVATAAGAAPVIGGLLGRGEPEVDANEDAGLFAEPPRAPVAGQDELAAREPVFSDLRADDFRGSFEEEPANPDPHVDDPRGSSWAGPFRSLLSRGRRDREEPREEEGHDDDRGPRF